MDPESSDSSGWEEAAALEAADVVAPATTSCRSTEQTHPCCVWKFVTQVQHAPVPYSDPHNTFNVAMLFLEVNKKHETENKANAANSSGAAAREGARCSSNAVRSSPTGSQVTLPSVLTRKPAACAKSRTSSRLYSSKADLSLSGPWLRAKARNRFRVAAVRALAMTST